MKNAEQIRKRLDEVIAKGSYTESIKALCNVTYDIGLDACEERSKMQEDIKLLRRFILGNGDIDDSILARLTGLERCMSDYTGDMKQIKDKLLGSLDKEDDGIIAKIDKTDTSLKNLEKKLTKLSDSLTWVLRLVGGAIVVELAIQLFKIAF
jgi:hypothetical protein